MKYLVITDVNAVTLINFDIVNSCNKSLVILDFQGFPVYNFYFLHRPERLVLDVSSVFSPLYFKKLPINFFEGQLVRCVRIDKLKNKQGMRFIFDLMLLSCVDDVFLEKMRGFNTVLLVITRPLSISLTNSALIKRDKKYVLSKHISLPVIKRSKNPFISYMKEDSEVLFRSCYMKMLFPIIVAIDAGHGGHDPGARGYSGLYEKNITISIAKKLKKLLDQDVIFSPIMIRDGDYFISVLDRSKLARDKGAKILLSIHADAISKHSKNNVRGSSVWVLSDRGVNIGMSYWLENTDQWSQLPGGVNNILVSSSSNPFDRYFHRAILDLQFCHSQKVGYKIASCILRELKNVGVLHKDIPEYSNFAVLRSLDIPSVLIETGFISNSDEEKLLASDNYQEKIAYAVYKGLRSYFLGHFFDFENVKDSKLYFNFKNYNKYIYDYYGCKCVSF